MEIFHPLSWIGAIESLISLEILTIKERMRKAKKIRIIPAISKINPKARAFPISKILF